MGYRILIQVPTELLDKAIEEISKELIKFAVIRKIPFENTYLLDAEVRSGIATAEITNVMRNRGIPFNFYSLSFHLAVRYTHMGEADVNYGADPSDVAENVRHMLSTKVWPDGCNIKTAELRGNCVAMRFEWENQIKNGRRYAMINMLGS